MSRDTVLRRGGRKGAGGDEQGQQKEKFTSGSEANASADSGRKKRKDKKNTRDAEVSVEDAFTALQRAAREPFTADESVIAKVDDATVKFDCSSGGDGELVMEGLPPGKTQPGTLYGHRGWVFGNESEEGGVVEGKEAKEGGEKDKRGSPRASKSRGGAGKSQPAVRTGVGPKRVKAGRQKDEFALSDDDGGGGSDDSKAKSSRAKRRGRVRRASGGKGGQQGQKRKPTVEDAVASDSDISRPHTPVHTMFSALFMTDSSSAPAAPTAASSSASCRPAASDSAESDSRRRCPRDARRWLRMALAIVILGSACCVSTAQGTWSTAQLSVARCCLAATSVGNVAIFAGGALFSPYGHLNVVDLYNSASGTWSTAQLSVARSGLAATSVGNVAIFAGGQTGNCSLTLFVEGLLVWLMRVVDGVMFACLRRWGLLFVVYVVEEVAVSLGSLQIVDVPMLLTCTTVHRAHGRLRSSVWRAFRLQRHPLGTWPSSRGVTQVIAVSRCLLRGCCLGRCVWAMV